MGVRPVQDVDTSSSTCVAPFPITGPGSENLTRFLVIFLLGVVATAESDVLGGAVRDEDCPFVEVFDEA